MRTVPLPPIHAISRDRAGSSTVCAHSAPLAGSWKEHMSPRQARQCPAESPWTSLRRSSLPLPNLLAPTPLPGQQTHRKRKALQAYIAVGIRVGMRVGIPARVPVPARPVPGEPGKSGPEWAGVGWQRGLVPANIFGVPCSRRRAAGRQAAALQRCCQSCAGCPVPGARRVPHSIEDRGAHRGPRNPRVVLVGAGAGQEGCPALKLTAARRDCRSLRTLSRCL